MPNSVEPDTRSKLEQIEKLLAERKHDNYTSLYGRLGEARELFHELLAARLTATFNEHLAEQPSETLAQKQMVAQQANAELRAIGLAIRCPKTGQPAILRGDHSGNPERGRFQICLAGDSSFARTRSFTQLVHLNLTGDRSPGMASESQTQLWADRAARGRRSPPPAK